jgi:hypothetical protein
MLKGQEYDHPPIVKLFSIAGSATRLLNELNPFEPTIAYGLCDLGMGFPELGYVFLEELEGIQHPFLPIPLIVQDEHFNAEYLIVFMWKRHVSISVSLKIRYICSKHIKNWSVSREKLYLHLCDSG